MELSKVYFFSSLSQDQIKKIEKITKTKKYKKGEFLFFEGEKPKYLQILLNGIIKIYKTTQNGSEIIINHFYPTTMIAEMPCFEHMHYPATAVCETDAEILLIDYDIFEKEFLNDPAVSFNIIKSLSKKIKNLDETFTRTITMNALQKCARFIYENEKLFCDLKQKKIAQILNITPETLSRTIKKFKNEEILDYKDKKLFVKKREALKTYFNQ